MAKTQDNLGFEREEGLEKPESLHALEVDKMRSSLRNALIDVQRGTYQHLDAGSRSSGGGISQTCSVFRMLHPQWRHVFKSCMCSVRTTVCSMARAYWLCWFSLYGLPPCGTLPDPPILSPIAIHE